MKVFELLGMLSDLEWHRWGQQQAKKRRSH